MILHLFLFLLFVSPAFAHGVQFGSLHCGLARFRRSQLT